MPSFVIYGWDLYTVPGLTRNELETSTHGNDYAQTGSNPYNNSIATWTGKDFTFNGGSGVHAHVNDDDGYFQDGYAETGGTQTLSAPVTIGGTTYPAGTEIQNEFSLLDNGLEVIVVRIGSKNVGFAYADGPAPTAGDVLNFDDTRDGAGEDSLDQTTSSEAAYANIVCFASGTMIDTAAGARCIDDIKVGDMVRTLDHGLQPLSWVSRTAHRWEPAPDKNKPILFRAGSLGRGMPIRDLIVSPQHRMLWIDESSGEEIFIPAKAMTGLPGVRQMSGCRRVEYHHLMFDRHEIIFGEGAPSESFFPGPWAMQGFQAMQKLQVASVKARWPIDRETGKIECARRVETVRKARDLLKFVRKRQTGFEAKAFKRPASLRLVH